VGGQATATISHESATEDSMQELDAAENSVVVDEVKRSLEVCHDVGMMEQEHFFEREVHHLM